MDIAQPDSLKQLAPSATCRPAKRRNPKCNACTDYHDAAGGGGSCCSIAGIPGDSPGRRAGTTGGRKIFKTNRTQPEVTRVSMDISDFIRPSLMKRTSCWPTWSNTC